MSEQVTGKNGRSIARRKLTMSMIVNAVKRDDGTGFCVHCRATRKGCEPDAQNYPCERCGEPAVMGAEEMLMRVAG
jgi:hypothetical protein